MKDRVLQNSNDVTVTSFLNQSQDNFVILLQILSCTFAANLSNIGLFMFPWQHILETALMRNLAIQLRNDVTVTLFLNLFLQNFEAFLEMISSTSVQNFSRRNCFVLKWQHIMQNQVFKIIDDVTVTSFCNQSQQDFVFLFVIPKSISVQNLSKIGQETKKFEKLKMTSL